MSFGFSISDVLVVAKLLSKVISALSESTGSSLHYQELMSTLYCYRRSVLEAEQICTLPATQFHTATMNAIAHVVSLSRAPIEAFLAKIERYRGLGPKCLDRSSWRKVAWGLFKNEEVRELRAVLATHADILNLLITTAGAKSSLRVEARQDEDRSLLNKQRIELENLRIEVARSVDILRQLQISVSFRNLGNSWEWNGEAPIQFMDALGRSLMLPLQLVGDRNVFEAMLRARFHEFPGEQRVQRGKYEIRDEADADRSLEKDTWAKLLFPGMRVTMNMVIERQIDGDQAYRCPRSDCNMLNVKEEDSTGVHCKRCGLWIQVIQSNRIEEVKDDDEEGDDEGLPLEDDDVRHFKRISLINHRIKQKRQITPVSSLDNMKDPFPGGVSIWYCPNCGFGPLNPHIDTACPNCGWYPGQSR